VLFALLYLLVRQAVRLAAGSASDLHNDIEIMVLRHQLAVLKRQVGRPRLRRRDRLFMAAVSRVLPRPRWSSFVVSLQTLLPRFARDPAPGRPLPFPEGKRPRLAEETLRRDALALRSLI
jgi:putative transposase